MSDFQRRASEQGRTYEEAVAQHLESFGWRITGRHWREPLTSVEIDLVAIDREGVEWWIECKGSWEGDRNGLVRTDTVKKLIANAALLALLPDRRPYMVITSDLPMGGSGMVWIGLAHQAGWIDEIKELGVI